MEEDIRERATQMLWGRREKEELSVQKMSETFGHEEILNYFSRSVQCTLFYIVLFHRWLDWLGGEGEIVASMFCVHAK